VTTPNGSESTRAPVSCFITTMVCRFLVLLPLLCAISVIEGCHSRTPKSTPTPQPQGGFSVRFANVANEVGIRHRWPVHARPITIKDAFGEGCAFWDYDNDGWMDVLLIATPHPLLFRNTGNGRFVDVTSALGLDQIQGDWTGCAVGDYDGDGYQDLLLTGFHRLALLHNLAGRALRDVTRSVNLPPDNEGHWGSSAGFMDLDGDGRLDLVIANYVVFGPKEQQYCELSPGVKTGCPPRYYHPEFPKVWQNVGGRRFRDASAVAGMTASHGKGLVLAFADVDGDGRCDFYIGNDSMACDLFLNQGHLRFRNAADEAGLATARDGNVISAMGADWGDYDHDGRADLVVTNFSGVPFQLYRATGPNLFENVEEKVGLAEPTTKPLGFGAKWIDIDNDGWQDLVFANGHVYDDPGRLDGFSVLRQPPMLFHNEQGRHFEDIAPKLGSALTTPLLGRGLAVGDFDNDGREDVLIVDYEGEPVLLHNLSANENHWTTIDLRGNAPNPFAYGAKVAVHAAGAKYIGFISPASSYLSSSDPRLHFGLGTATRIDRVEITWPDGRREIHQGLPVDKILHLREGKSPPD
jgi:hypothetical protein